MRIFTPPRTVNSFVGDAGRWLLAFLCVLALAFAGLAAQPRDAWAGESLSNCGPNLSTNIGGDPRVLIIGKISATGTSAMYEWNGNDSSLASRPWHSAREDIYSLNIDSGVTNIGAYAFHGCSNLTMATIPKTVSSVGIYAFAGCSRLKTVVWDGTLAEWEAFLSRVPEQGNSALKSADLQVCQAAGTAQSNLAWTLGFDGTLTIWPADSEETASLPDKGGYATGIWYAMRDKVTAIVIEPGITQIGGNAFAMMENLTSVTLPEGLARIMPQAFYDCCSLKSVVIPASVENMGGFESCNALEKVTFKGSPESVDDYTFSGCSSKLVITGYAVDVIDDYNLTVPSYCEAHNIRFNAVNGDKGAFVLDLTGSNTKTYNDYATNIEVNALWASLTSQPSVHDTFVDMDLDGDGKEDLAWTDDYLPGQRVIERASACNIKPSITFKLTQEQRLIAAQNSKSGYYYSTVTVRFFTLPISTASVSIPAQTYSGKALKPAATVKLGGKTLVAGTDYTVSYSNNKNVGTAKATITGKTDYTGTITKTFKINKAKPTVKAKKATVTVKYAKVKKKAQTVENLTLKCDKGKATYKNASSGQAKKFKVNAKNGKVTVPKGTKKGTYKVKVKVAVKASKNYKKLTKTVSFKVKVK